MTAERLGPNFPSGIKRVHVGCGPHAILPDWWNVDVRKFRGIDDVIDAAEPWPYTDLDFVFAEHFIEHLTLDRGLTLLIIHTGNSLRPGGVIRLLDTLRTNRAFHGWGHEFLYSKEMLVHMMRKIGYEKIDLCEYGQSSHPELNDLEKHGKFSIDGGFPSVVIVEASRGQAPLAALQTLLDYLQENYLRYVASGH
jgi:hypothetical protein